MPFADTYGKYSVVHGNDEYYADVGRGSVWVTKENDAWILALTIGDATEDLNGNYTAPVLKKAALGAGDLADGQPELLFAPHPHWMGWKPASFTIEIKELVDPKKPSGSFHTYKLAFELFESEKDNPVYDKLSTDKKGDPAQRDPGIFSPDVAKKLVFNATDTTDMTDTTGTTTSANMPLLLGVGLMVVAVGSMG